VPPGVETPASTTKQREQNKETQKKDLVDVVAQDLENFGMTTSAITKLVQDYPAAYIREKLEMAKGLVAAGSCLVSQNPAGWLRKAIEEDYAPPSISQRHRPRHIREKKDTKPVHAEPREQQMPKEEHRQVKEEASSEAAETTSDVAETTEQHSPQLVGEDGLSTVDVWSKALDQLKEALPLGEAEARLRGTTAQRDNPCTGNRHRS
jgi:hypothetical protein